MALFILGCFTMLINVFAVFLLSWLIMILYTSRVVSSSKCCSPISAIPSKYHLSLFNIPAITSCSNSILTGFFTFYTPPITYLHTYLLPCRLSLLSLRHTALPLCTLVTLRQLVRTSVPSCTYSPLIYSLHHPYA